MKWAIVILVVLGVLAAAGVAVLVASLPHLMGGRDSADAGEPAEVPIVVAAEDLQANTIVRAESVAVISVPASEAPKEHFSRREDVIGKVLTRSVVETERFAPSYFATRGSSLALAAVMADDSRAVELALPDYAGLRSLLYPGCVVDVLAAFGSPTRQGEPVSTTLLQGILVLTVDGQTIYPESESRDAPLIGQGATKRMLVVVQVSPQQAQTLLLAQENGTISLALRKPTDIAAADVEPTRLSQLVSEAAPEVATQGLPAGPAPVLPQPAEPTVVEPVLPAVAGPAEPLPAPAGPTEPAEQPSWHTTVIRGSLEEVVVFPIDRAVQTEPEDDEPSETDSGR